MRRWIAAIFAILLGGVVGYAHGGSIHRYGGTFDYRIPSNPLESKGWMEDAIIEIRDDMVIHDLDIKINVTHTSIFDLQVYLQSPSGTSICLNIYNPIDEFFFGGNYIDTIFDDEASISIKDADAPFTGSFQPVWSLSAFDNENAYGDWTLRIYDARYFDIGFLENVELIISTPEPATFLLLILGGGIMLKYRRGKS